MVDFSQKKSYNASMQNYSISVHKGIWRLMHDQTVVLACNSRQALISEITHMLSAAVHSEPVVSNTVNQNNVDSGLDLVFGGNTNV